MELNFVYSHFFSEYNIYPFFSAPGYESIESMAIANDFTATWMIKAMQMGNLSKFYFMSESYKTRSCILTESNFQTITISLFLIPQWAVKPLIITKSFENKYDWH